MSIPDKVKIGGLNYNVVYSDRLMNQDRRFGETRFIYNEIAIDSGIPIEHQEETLLHEVLEVVNGHMEMNLKHRDICLLSQMLYQVLKDNKLKFGE